MATCGVEQNKRVAIIGVTGFVGCGLPQLFQSHGMTTTGVSRGRHTVLAGVNEWQTLGKLDLAGHHAVINLAGERIDQRWNVNSLLLFHQSRVGVTESLVQSLAAIPAAERPKVLVNASAVGIYGNRDDELLPDRAARGSGYLADLCSDWEKAALQAESLGVRVVCMRIGIVLGRDGAAFKKLVAVFKWGIGGRLGSGQQWMPWIHVSDLRAAFVKAVLDDSLRGPVNGTAPFPQRNADFTRILGAALHRPAIFPVPACALHMVLGEFASALLAGQRTQPQALAASGFEFSFPHLEGALVDLLAP